MADVLVLSSSPLATERVRRALQMEQAAGVHHRLRRARGWVELADFAAGSAAALAFVDPYYAGSLAAAEIRRLRLRFSTLELVAYADFSRRPASDPFALALLGVRAVLPLGADDNAVVLRQCLEDWLGWTPFESLLARLRSRVPAPAREWVEAVLRSPAAPRTAEELAALARCSPRTLRRTLRAAGLPGAERLLAWRGLLHAARLLQDGRSADSVARALDYSSGSALRKSLKRVAGLRPSELAARGGLRLLGELFLHACGAQGEDDPRPVPVAATGRALAG